MATENANIPKFPFPRPESSYDPPAELKNLRDAGPVHRIQLFDGTNAWIVTKNKEVCEMLTSEKFSNERYTRQGYPEIHSGGKKGGEKPTFVHMDDPEHSKQKDMVESFFTLAAVEPLRPEIERAVDLLLDSIKERGCKDGPIDLVQDFSSLVNPKVIFALFGASMMDTDQLAGSSAALGGTSGTAGELGHTDLHEYLSSLIDDRIQYADRPERDLISKLVIEQYKTGAMGKDDINRLVYMLFVAGNTAINSSISLGILSLLQHPKQLNAIRENPRLVKQAVEEILRYHTPSALNSRRVAKEDVRLGNQYIKAGEGVIGSVRSANRDPDMFPVPDRFDIHRMICPSQNLAFGYGPHRCQGQWLSRLELEVALGALIKRLPSLRLAAPFDTLEYTPPTQNVGLMHLPVYF